MFKFIVDKDVRFPNSIQMSEDLKDIILKLLKKDPKERLGYSDPGQIEKHPWFKSVDINELMSKKVFSLKFVSIDYTPFQAKIKR